MLKEFKKMNRNKGEKGEEVAVSYLKNKKYKILGRNIRYKNGEIDIVAILKDVIVCIEVKAQYKKDDIFLPQDHFDYKKARQVARVFSQYILENKLEDKEQRIDLVTVVFEKDLKEVKIEHYKNVV